MPNTCYTYFKIIGHFDPDVITERLSLQPFETWRDGTSGQWCFGRCDSYSPYVEEQMRKTIAPLLDKTNILMQIRQEFNAVFFQEIVPTVYHDEPTPCLAPPLDIIGFCHETRAEIDIDLYMGVD